MERSGRRPTLARRLLTRFALVLLALLAVLGVVLDRMMESAFVEDLTGSLVAQARTVRSALPEAPAELQPFVAANGRETGLRITIILLDGSVVADSSRDPSGIENHRDLPEVRSALGGEVGVTSRALETGGRAFSYVALPPENGRIVRVALPLAIVGSRLARVRLLIAGGSAIAAVVGIGSVWLVARGLRRGMRRVTEAVSRLSEGGLDTPMPADGTSEPAALAETLSRMAARLDDRISRAREEGRTHEVILSAMEEGVLLLAGDGAITYSNRAADRLLGWRRAAGWPPRVRGVVNEARRVGEAREEDIEIGHPGRAIRVSAVPVGLEDRVLVVLRDVTEARRVDAMRRDFVANASHELKTPVASIRAAAETMRGAARADPEAAASFADRIHRDAVRLTRIVSDLLDLSRLEAERPDFAPVRLDRLAGEEIERHRDRARQSGIALELSAAPATVDGSERDLSLLLGNVLDNALRFTPAGGRVSVEVSPSGGVAVLSVRDTGIGIAGRDLPRIFERFYRADESRSRDTGGTGLGLSIARHVAEQHGGRIDAESELGRGSTFRISLPLSGTQR